MVMAGSLLSSIELFIVVSMNLLMPIE